MQIMPTRTQKFSTIERRTPMRHLGVICLSAGHVMSSSSKSKNTPHANQYARQNFAVVLCIRIPESGYTGEIWMGYAHWHALDGSRLYYDIAYILYIICICCPDCWYVDSTLDHRSSFLPQKLWEDQEHESAVNMVFFPVGRRSDRSRGCAGTYDYGGSREGKGKFLGPANYLKRPNFIS